MKKTILFFDDEIIGEKKPVFMVGVKNKSTGKREAFWFHKRGHMKRLGEMLRDPRYTWVGFNSENFDRPLIAMATSGRFDVHAIKEVATAIIAERLRSWQTYREFLIDFIEYDHIDLFDVSPGVMISLKTYAGRLGHKRMVDLPFHHDDDLTPAQQKTLEDYCLNDLDVTDALFHALPEEMELRRQMSAEYGIDLRSKSDPQIAEAVLKSRVGVAKGERVVPRTVGYRAPKFIKTDSEVINEIIGLLEEHRFKIQHTTGAPIVPPFFEETVQIGDGTYQCGVGGLHSTHDQGMYLEATENLVLSDFDVASYYPKIMLEARITPNLLGGKSEKFLNEYERIFNARIEAKSAGNKKVANSLKIVLNGAFGKLGSIYCSFYAPEALIAVTLTGQLNLLCLIHELEQIKGVKVKSANTDGILVAYIPKARASVLKVFERNSKRTNFTYEETQYLKYAAKDVNNYIAVKKAQDKATGAWFMKPDGAKTKGLYASNNPKLNPLFLQKNPTMEVCSLMAIDYLLTGVVPEVAIRKYKDIRDFVAIRNVQGGGIQYDKYIMVDDWFEVEPGVWRRPTWPSMKASNRRKSRPAPVECGTGGTPFGRVARWYMTTQNLPPLSYLSSGNKVAKTEGAKVCMTLPDKLPADLDKTWYVNETYSILESLGVKISPKL